MDFARYLCCSARRTWIKKIIADEMRSRGLAAELADVAQFSNASVRGTAAEKSALTIGRDVDVEEASHCIGGALDPARVNAAFLQTLENIVTEVVASDATGKADVDSPARQCHRRICAHAAAMHL